MTPRLTRFIRRRPRASLALATVALSATALTGTAAAAPSSGEVSLTLKRGAESSLLRQGVKVTYSAKAGKTGATKRAARKQGSVTQKVTLPVVNVNLLTATVSTGGGLSFALGGEKATVTELQLEVSRSETAISGKLGKERLVLFRAKGAPSINGSSVKLSGAKLALTGAGSNALREALGLERTVAGKLGSAGIDAKVNATTPAPTPGPTPTGPQPTGPNKPAPLPDPYAADCPVPIGASGAFGAPAGAAAAPSAEPTFGVAQDVTDAAIQWGFKQSFRSYVVNVPPAGSLLGVEGATPPATGALGALPGAFFEFAADEGTYEAGSTPNHSDDKLVVDGTGTMLFCKPGHGFDIAFKNPTVVIDGTNSRIVADVGADFDGTWHPFQRTDIAELDLSGVAPTITEGGNEITWEDVPATLTADGVAASGLGGFYNAGEPLDPITVETTLDRPLLTQCAISAGTGTQPRPTVDFTKAALPTLSSPVIGSGGTIDWGFRRSTRATSFSGGHFDLLGGATEGYPGNMGGGASPAPTGGEGKFFRFPIASYAYDAGTASATDDKLIATSNATVSFCNVNQGAFAVVLSKPTLIVNGSSSRLVANAYSFRANMGWIGGRVDLVNLDASAVSAVSAGNTVSWGMVPADNSPLTSGIPVSGALLTNALSVATLTPASTATGWDPLSAQIVLPTP